MHRVGNEIAKTRVLLKFGFENGLVDKQIRFGDFKRPAKSAYRRRRAEVGSRMFEPADLATILEVCDIQLRAMVLLGLNAGFGNNDCGTLPIKALDLKRGWLDHARPKTGIPRRVPLWPETVAAIKAVLANRKEPTDKKHAGLVFITKYGGPWFHDDEKSRAAPLSAEFRKLLQELKLHRPGASFYSLRHVFQTIGEETGDNVAIRRIMGHADQSMSDIYRERFPDDRLKRVTDHVRSWVFPPKPAKAGKRGAK